MTNISLGQATPRPLTRQVRGETAGWTMDALTGAMPSNVTFSRASGGGYFDNNGVWQMAATDIPRLDYNPATLGLRGLMIEGQRTNLLLWNRDLTNAAWIKTNITAAKTATGIDGVTNSASRLTATSANGSVLQAVTSANAARATSAYVRRVSGSGIVEMTQNGGTTWTAVTLTNSWARVGPSSATIVNPSVGFRIGTSGDVIDVDYVQLESAAFASSAIATTTASATRAADICYIGNLSSIGYNPSEGTLVVYGMRWVDTTGDNGGNLLAQLDDGTETHRQNLGMNGGISYSVTSYVSANAFAALTPNVLQKGAFAYKTGDSAATFNGVVPATSVAASTSGSNFNRLNIGMRTNGATRHLYGWIQKVMYYPTRLTNGQLQALTL